MSSAPVSLYNGVSNRSRGWKSRTLEPPVEPTVSKIMRWDGAARSYAPWDSLRRDPELWYRNGNCVVHLYAQGQSQRGPAFKLPLQVLLDAHCGPLIDRFVGPDSVDETGQRRVELYIAAPPSSDRVQSFNHHLATRNFFAWIFRRSLVGEHLGTALISLLERMYECRSADSDNLTSLLSYMDEEGYLDLRSRPAHAIAVLRLAEAFYLQGLYIHAFAHCCGMSDQLARVPEYLLVSAPTKRLLRHGRVEMDSNLDHVGSMLATLLTDELSEAQPDLCSGARVHLDRFRTLLRDFYTAKFGCYPPLAMEARTRAFPADMLSTMRLDFESLFQYLVDESYDVTKAMPMPPRARAGLDTLQSVHSFDARHGFAILQHPLPLLPEIGSATARRMSWVQPKPNERPALHVALLKATNQHKLEALSNDLVGLYRKFEQDSVYLASKADRQDSIGLVHGRKVRWILIYALYQTIRQATETPPEVRDVINAPYNLCISTANLPPWSDDTSNLTRAQRHTLRLPPNTPPGATGSASAGAAGPGPVLQPAPLTRPTPRLKADMDTLAVAHGDDPVPVDMGTITPSYPKDLQRSITRKMLPPDSPIHRRRPTSLRQQAAAGEMIHGGTASAFEAIKAAGLGDESRAMNTVRTSSTSSKSSSTTYLSRSEAGSVRTVATSVAESPTSASYTFSGTRQQLAFPRTTPDDACREEEARPQSYHGPPPPPTAAAAVVIRRRPLNRAPSLPETATKPPRGDGLEPEPLRIRSRGPRVSENPFEDGEEDGEDGGGDLLFVNPNPAVVDGDMDARPEWDMGDDLGPLTDGRTGGGRAGLGLGLGFGGG